MKTSSRIGLVIVACLFVAAITAGTALAVWGSGNGDLARAKAEASSGGKMAQAVRGNSSTKPAQGMRGRQGLAAGVLDQVAQELGMTPQDLLSELKGGKTLAQIASEKGADLNTLIDKIMEPLKTRLSKMVENGKIMQDQADSRLSDLTKKLTDWANNGGPLPGRPGAQVLDAVAQQLGMTPQDLLSELKGGKTLAQIASEKGADLNTLIDKIMEAVKTRLSKMVENGKITQDQADSRLSDLTKKLTDWANNGGPLPGRSDPSGNGSVKDRGPEGPDESPPGADMV